MKKGEAKLCTLHIRICLWKGSFFFFSFVQIYMNRHRIKHTDATIQNIINFLKFFSFKKILALDFYIHIIILSVHMSHEPNILNDKKLKILCILCAYFFLCRSHFVFVFSFCLPRYALKPGVMANGMESYKIYTIVKSNWIHAKQTTTTAKSANSKGTRFK